jgi:sulfur carrier protein
MKAASPKDTTTTKERSATPASLVCSLHIDHRGYRHGETASAPRLPDTPQVVKAGSKHYLLRVHVTINGEPQALSDSLTIADLLTHLGLGERRIAIEVNREIIARDRYAAHALADGDQVEIVHFVGGG